MNNNSDQILTRLMSLHPKVIDLVLDRVWRLLDKLGNPQNKLPPVIHAAGTNGKGSTLAFLRAALEADGHSVHVYSSPHLVRFHERISLNGRWIKEAKLSAYLERCEEANAGAPITYFEITTVAALLAFAEHKANYLLLETGLGGRLDATNVVAKPALTLITPISKDHEQFLGNTLAAIAFEKAGILKAGVPCLSSEQAPEVAEVLATRTHTVGAKIQFIGPKTYSFDLALRGQHQHQNASLAEAAAEALGVSAQAISKGLANAQWPGRFQRLGQSVWQAHLEPDQELWLDGGHNAAAGQAIADYAQSAWQDKPLHIIFGMLNTKDAQGFLKPLLSLGGSMTAIQIPEQENSLSAEEARTAVQALEPGPDMQLSAAHGLAQALSDLPPGPARVLICGSLYLAGWVLGQDEKP